MSAISLHLLDSLDHLCSENCRTALAAASLLDITRQGRTDEEMEDLYKQRQDTLRRIHSEACDIDSRTFEKAEGNFRRQIDDLRALLDQLLSIKSSR